jgi:hypothetical protein
VTQFNKDQIDEAVAQLRAAAEQAEPEQPNTVAVNCTGCGREMKVVETQRIPRCVDPPSGLKVRRLATGQQSWYCSEVCFREHQS